MKDAANRGPWNEFRTASAASNVYPTQLAFVGGAEIPGATGI